MRSDVTKFRALKLVGGNLCLDFMNTIDWRDTKQAREWLNDCEDLITWNEYAGAIDKTLPARLRIEAKRHKSDADRVLHQAIKLREVLYLVFSAIARGEKAPAPANAAQLNRQVFRTLKRTRLEWTDKGIAEVWDGKEDSLERILWPIAHSASRLLVSPDIERVRECARENCRWLFLDRSRNRSRRWCEMQQCGNVVNARRHYRRRRLSLKSSTSSATPTAASASR